MFVSLIDCIRANVEPPPALARAVARLRADGFTPSEGACYQRANGSAYASSLDTARRKP